jgi:hypothetical protein
MSSATTPEGRVVSETTLPDLNAHVRSAPAWHAESSSLLHASLASATMGAPWPGERAPACRIGRSFHARMLHKAEVVVYACTTVARCGMCGQGGAPLSSAMQYWPRWMPDCML